MHVQSPLKHPPRVHLRISFASTERDIGTLVREDLPVAVEMLERSKQG